MTLGNVPKQPSQEVLARLEMLTIDIVSGRIYLPLRADGWGGREIGKPKGNTYATVCIKVNGQRKNLRRSHIIWWKAKGYWPRMTIDHRDISKHNDRIDNLREATMEEQIANQRHKLRFDQSSTIK